LASQPKEMLPVARQPIVQYVVEELVSNGMQQVLFVILPRARDSESVRSSASVR
jgi:UTP-glucose-1-phosphate uridylyltransferase